MGYRLNTILAILCIGAAIHEYFEANSVSLLILYLIFAVVYFICLFLIATQSNPDNINLYSNWIKYSQSQSQSQQSSRLHISHIGFDLTAITSLILALFSLILLIYPFDPFNKKDSSNRKNPTISILIILFLLSSLCCYLNIKKSLRYLQMIKDVLFTIEKTGSSNEKMKAIVVKEYGNVNDIIDMVNDCPKPLLTPNSTNELVIKVLSCSLSPSDYRMWSGAASLVKSPPNGFPYIPLGDVCGIVEQVSSDEETQNEFQIGDYIVATWDEFGIGCLAEYALIKSKFATKVSQTLIKEDGNINGDNNDNNDNNEKEDEKQSSSNVKDGRYSRDKTPIAVRVCAMANTAVIAYDDVSKCFEMCNITKDSRILILGGSGGMGTAIIRYIRQREANVFIASTSTDEALLIDTLKVDRFIDYTKENWWEIEEFEKNPFDLVIDCAEGSKGFNKGCQHKIVKTAANGGVWMAVVINDWHIAGQKIWDMVSGFAWPTGKRAILNKMRSNSEPEYVPTVPNVSKEKLANVLNMYEKNEFDVVLDDESPFDFSVDGVKNAFRKHESRKGHGKIVIQVSQ